MKKLIPILATVLAFSCAEKDITAYYEYSEPERLTIAGNEGHSYLISRPLNAADSMPLVVFIDSKGDAENTLVLGIDALNFCRATIVCSELIKNNHQDFISSIKELVDEFPSARQVYMAGFSGGGRMALAYSRQYEIDALMMIGAGPGLPMPELPFYGIGGLRDFNLLELYQRPVLTRLGERNFQLDYFRGGHEWPSGEVLRDGFIFLMKNQDEEVGKYADVRSKVLFAYVDSLRGNPMLSWKSLEKSFQFSSDESFRKEIQEKVREIRKDKVFTTSLQSLENYLKLENTLKQQYLDNSLVKDLSYWKKEIDGINEKIMYSSNMLEIDHNYRLKGFLGILFYSRLQILSITPERQDLAKTLIDAFARLEPENPDMLYFKALYHTNRNEMDSAGHYLALARKSGLIE